MAAPAPTPGAAQPRATAPVAASSSRPALPGSLASALAAGAAALRPAPKREAATPTTNATATGSDLQSVLRRGLAERFARVQNAGGDASAGDQDFTFSTLH